MAGSNASRGRLSLVDSGLITRVLTAIVAIPAVIAVVFLGGWTYNAVIIAAAVIAAWEAFQMLRVKGHRPALLLGLAYTGLVTALAGVGHSAAWTRGTVLVGLMVMATWFLVGARSTDGFVDWLASIGVPIYIGGLLGTLISMRGLSDGLRLVLFVLILTWSYDTGAYFAGRGFGKRPFMQRISPSKTWEGVAGGVALTVLIALIAAVPCRVNLAVAVIAGLAIAVAGQAGDLLESLMKRYCGVKDSGVIIPGHGGLLDRIDSLFFTSATAYYVFLAAGFH